MAAVNQIIQLLDQYPTDAAAHVWMKPKPNGEVRPITVPNDTLGAWLSKMNSVLAKQFSNWPCFIHGGIKKRSYITYARPHVNKSCVITIDIKHCFDAIPEYRVDAALRQHIELSDDNCTRLARCLCFNGRVAQGFAASNFLCNLYLLAPMLVLNESLVSCNLTFGSYVDDLAVSGVITDPADIVNDVAVALSRANLKMNKAKVKIMPASQAQVVCGLLVNKRLTLTQTLKRRLLSDVANGRMSVTTLAGWRANLQIVDPIFGKKLTTYANRVALR